MDNVVNLAGAADAITAETVFNGVKQVMLIMADMIRMFVRLCVDVLGHMANFEGMIDGEQINQMSGQIQGAFEAARQGSQA